MVTSTFNAQTGILEAEFTGDVTLKQVVDYIQGIQENKSFPRKLKVITNATKANFNFSVADLDVLVLENINSTKKYDYIIDAMIVSAPQTTAISMLYREFSKNNKYKFDVFSTHEMASEWLANL